MTTEEAKARVQRMFPGADVVCYQVLPERTWTVSARINMMAFITSGWLSQRGAWNAALEKLRPGSVIPLDPTPNLTHLCRP